VAEKPGYWDVHRCAWVGAEPTYVVPPLPEPAADEPSLPADEAAVPEQRPAIAIASPLVAGTPD